MTVTFGSVCSGIEAASVAWEPLGMRASWLSEIEPFPSAVLAHHWPEVPNLGDMTQLPAAIRAGMIQAPDVLVGGTPCQAFSVAGLRKGLDDDRGQLTLTYVDILNAIDEQRPGNEAVCVWENVPGVLSSRDNAFGCFLAALVGEDVPLEPSGKKWTKSGVVFGPQRTAAWRILDAQYFGVAQRRRRVFVVASAREGFDPCKVLFESEGVRRDTPPSRETGQDASCATSSSFGGYREGVGTLRANGGDYGGGTENLLPVAGHCRPAGVAATLNASFGDKQGLEDQHALSGASWFVPTEAYGFQQRIARNGRGDMGELCVAGNAQSGQTGKGDAAPCVAIGGDISHTLRGEGFDASEDGTGRGTPIVTAFETRQDPMSYGDIAGPCSAAVPVNGVHSGSTVRRLTPVECERLQGFSDGHTQIPWRGKSPADCPDGPRYKAIGNSKAVPVVRWLGKRLLEELSK